MKNALLAAITGSLLAGCWNAEQLARMMVVERADTSQVDLRNEQTAPDQSVRIERDCEYTLLGIPISTYANSGEAEERIMRFAPPHTSSTKAVYSERGTIFPLVHRFCWQVWIRFEGVPN